MANPLPPPLEALEVRLRVPVGSLTGEDAAAATAALSDATEEVLGLLPAAKAAAWRLDCPGNVHTIILKAARREYDNPEGFVQEGLGEHSATVGTASGVYLTDDEKEKVKRAAGLVGFTGTVRIPSAYGFTEATVTTVPALGGPVVLIG